MLKLSGMRDEITKFAWIAGFFLFFYFLPVEQEAFREAIISAFELARWYAREHVLLCLIPAFFISGAIAVLVGQGTVIRYLGPKAVKWKAYLIASVSGAILAVCSCTVLPLFSGIRQRGAGLGTATTFLYSGPAINILAVILTARILGWELGLARITGAIVFSILIGLIMNFLFRKEEGKIADEQMEVAQSSPSTPLWKTAFHFIILILILVFATWGEPHAETGFLHAVWAGKWYITSFLGILLMFSLVYTLAIKAWKVISAGMAVVVAALIFPGHPVVPFTVGVAGLVWVTLTTPGQPQEWFYSSWDFTKQIMPLLGAGVLVAGFLLGVPDESGGIIPGEWVAALVGGNSLPANFFASILGAFMYFATLTEIPIIQGLLASGMGRGPALALLLAGPALSLPNMLVIRSVLGNRRTVAYIVLVSVMSTIAGLIYGAIYA